MPTDPAAIYAPPGNAPAAPVAPPAPAAATPQEPGSVVAYPAAQVAALAVMGTGPSTLVLTARAPGVDGNRITAEIDVPSATDPLFISWTTTEGDVQDPPHGNLYVVPAGVPAVAASVQITVPISHYVSLDATWIIAGSTQPVGGILSSNGTQARANLNASMIQAMLNSCYAGLLAASCTANVISVCLLNGGTAGNSVTIAKGAGTNTTVLSSGVFSGGAESTVTTASQLAAAINSRSNCGITAVPGNPGTGAVMADFRTLSGGSGLAAPPDVRWPAPGPCVAPPPAPPAGPAAAPQQVGPLATASTNSPPAPPAITP